MSYNQDRLQTDHNAPFLADRSFRAAYERGVQAVGHDYEWEWRVHTALWVARQAAELPGDFVECGTNYGFMASAIMTDLNWNSRCRSFWLCDTWAGIDETQLTNAERDHGVVQRAQEAATNGTYTFNFGKVLDNFNEWNRIHFILGSVPSSLIKVTAPAIAFLHLDMNCARPEAEALQYFWPRIVHHGFVLADDYCYVGYELQGEALREMGRTLGVEWLALPTGQGLLIKP